MSDTPHADWSERILILGECEAELGRICAAVAAAGFTPHAIRTDLSPGRAPDPSDVDPSNAQFPDAALAILVHGRAGASGVIAELLTRRPGLPVVVIADEDGCADAAREVCAAARAAHSAGAPGLHGPMRGGVQAADVAQLRRLLAQKTAENRLLAAAVDRLRAVAQTDGLTGLSNRRGLQTRLDELFVASRRYGTELACLMIDVDNFKLVNDTLGHAAGDELLRLVAETIRGQCRRCDTAARYGGDEFVVLLPQTPVAASRRLAERIVAAFRARSAAIAERIAAAQGSPVRIVRGNPRRGATVDAPEAGASGAQRAPGLGLSVGIAGRLASDPSSGEQLLAHADLALYAAKRSGDRIASHPPGVGVPARLAAAA